MFRCVTFLERKSHGYRILIVAKRKTKILSENHRLIVVDHGFTL